ncbi:unnamed protein product [Cuscuta campestris]|uniref:cytokinin riboside 5'-monophosphate phosphoribohydrolase n=1 Tax=Cuscuta campestris TaxID=132261 RepID=A0A484LEV1_9ASTE|nr:unnamed protein product [Cuscuta campestris]
MFMATAVDLGRELIRRRISLAYGGGNIGLQGAVASTVFTNGGLVRGFIPGYIATRRVYGPTYGVEHTVSCNYYKYFEMNHAVEAFIVLPGGVDTMEGLFSLISWASEGLHNRPIGLLNIDGYFNNLIKFLDDAVRQNFVSLSQRKLFISSFFVDELLDKLEFAKAFPGPGVLIIDKHNLFKSRSKCYNDKHEDLKCHSLKYSRSHSLGRNPKFMATAVDLGRELIRRRISLAYGGGNVGLQGAVASIVFTNGGLVRGFIPGYIATRRVYGPTYGVEHTVSCNYYKYFEMNHAVEAFIVLPGGVDTMEGLFSLISWASEGLHNIPIGLMNIDGNFNNLIKFLDDAVRQNFVYLSQRKLFISSFFVDELLEKLEFAKAFPGPGSFPSLFGMVLEVGLAKGLLTHRWDVLPIAGWVVSQKPMVFALTTA